jgi:hypothetical protein
MTRHSLRESGAGKQPKLRFVTMSGTKLDGWRRVCQEEREAWAKARDRLPGSPDYDALIWQAWQAAIERVDETRRRMLDSLGNHDE